jgi:outer membrane receptor for ferrienterochelin and colicins
MIAMEKIIKLVVMLLINQVVCASNDVPLDVDSTVKGNSLSMETVLKIPLEELMQIEVVSKQKEDKNSAAGIVSIVTREDIHRYGGNNLFEILNRIPSVNMLGTALFMKGTVSMRGDFSDSSDTHTLILMNGRPFRDSIFGGFVEGILRDFPIHHIERIEVIRGSGSVLYGTNAFSAVINIVTEKNKQNSVTLRGRYGSYQTGQVESEFSWKNTQASLTGAARFRTSQGSQVTLLHDNPQQSSAFRTGESDASVSLTGEWENLSFNAFLLHADGHNWGVDRGVNGQPQQDERIFFDLGYKNSFNEHWTSQWNFTYNHLSNKVNTPAFIPPDFPNRLSSLSENNLLFEQTQFFNFLDKKLNFLIGGLVEWQTGRINQIGIGAILPTYHHLKSSVYGEASYMLLQDLPFIHQLKVTVGGQWHRMDHLEKSPDGLPDKPIEGKVGRLGLVYEITPALGLKLLYSQAFRAASAFELGLDSLYSGYRNLQPERVETADVQFFYHAADYQASLTAFRSRQSNLIVLPDRVYTNADSVIYRGLELETKARFFKSLQWQGAYTFQTSQDGKGQNNFSTMPNHIAKIGLSYDVSEDLQASVFYAFLSRAKVAPTQLQLNPKAGDDHLVSLNVNYQLDKLLGLYDKKRMTFSFYVDNLLNEKTYYPQSLGASSSNTLPGNSGRTLYGEVAVEF